MLNGGAFTAHVAAEALLDGNVQQAYEGLLGAYRQALAADCQGQATAYWQAAEAVKAACFTSVK
jgi:hypothetical protein